MVIFVVVFVLVVVGISAGLVYSKKRAIHTVLSAPVATSATAGAVRAYLRRVYPMAGDTWNSMSDDDVEEYYRNLQVYYEELGPDAPRVRSDCSDPWVLGVGSRVEVLGPTSRGESMTAWIPARGSGRFVDAGRCLIAFNKVHALNLLGVGSADAAPYMRDPDRYADACSGRCVSGKGRNFVQLTVSGEEALANLARTRGYDSVLVLRERRAVVDGFDVMGMELVLLDASVESERWDPFSSRLLTVPRDAASPVVKYLIRGNTQTVVVDKDFRPDRQQVMGVNLVTE